jgi:formyltetrahydrofolate synthetase
MGGKRCCKPGAPYQYHQEGGHQPVVCLNSFYTDTKRDQSRQAHCRSRRRPGALSKHWQYGGDGALEFADAVIDACNEPNDFKFLYELETPLRERIDLIAREVYGADGVDYTPEALAKAKRMEQDPEIQKLGPAWSRPT